MAKNVVYDSIDSPNISQRRNARAETAPVLVDEEEEEAPVVSEQHEVPYHPHHGAQVPEGVPHAVQLQVQLPPQVGVQHPRQLGSLSSLSTGLRVRLCVRSICQRIVVDTGSQNVTVMPTTFHHSHG